MPNNTNINNIKGTSPWIDDCWSATEDSVSHGLCKKIWGEVPTIKEKEKVLMETALKILKILLGMGHDKFFITIR